VQEQPKKFQLPFYSRIKHNPDGSYSENANAEPNWLNLLSDDLQNMEDPDFMNSLQFRRVTMKEFNLNMRVLSLFDIKMRPDTEPEPVPVPSPVPVPNARRPKRPCDQVLRKLAGNSKETNRFGSATLDLLRYFADFASMKGLLFQSIPNARADEPTNYLPSSFGISASASLEVDLKFLKLSPGMTLKPQVFRVMKGNSYGGFSHAWKLGYSTEYGVGVSPILAGAIAKPKPLFSVGGELSYGAFFSASRIYALPENAASGGFDGSTTLCIWKICIGTFGTPHVTESYSPENQTKFSKYVPVTTWRNRPFNSLPQPLTFNSPADAAKNLSLFNRGIFTNIPRLKYLNKKDNNTYMTNTQDHVNQFKNGGTALKNQLVDMKKYEQQLKNRLDSVEKIKNSNGFEISGDWNITQGWGNFDHQGFSFQYSALSDNLLGFSGELSSETFFFDYARSDWEAMLKIGAGVIGAGVLGGLSAEVGWQGAVFGGLIGLAAPFLAEYIVSMHCNLIHMDYLLGLRTNIISACVESQWNFTPSEIGDRMKDKFYEP
jgi:hypothetical protein